MWWMILWIFLCPLMHMLKYNLQCEGSLEIFWLLRKELTWKALIPLSKSPQVLSYPFDEDAAKPQLSVNQGKLNLLVLWSWAVQFSELWKVNLCCLLLSFMSTGHKLQSFWKRDPQLSNCHHHMPCERDCGAFFWSMVDVGVHSLLCALSLLSFWSWVP